MSVTTPFDWPAGRRWQRRFLSAAAGGIALCAIGALVDTEQTLHSYLFAYFAWLGIALGSLGLWMLHNLTGGAWGLTIRQPLQAATRTLPPLSFLFFPIGLGFLVIAADLPPIYPWVMAPNGYLNVP